MAVKYLSIAKAAERDAEEGFPQNVRREVIPRLMKRGLLNGKTVRGKPAVADDEAFARVMRYGIERFAYNQDAWSFTGVRAPIDAVAGRLKGRRGVLLHEPNVKVVRMREAGVEATPDRRHVFLVKPRDSDWSVILQTVHWVQPADMIVGGLLAAELSQGLKTRAVAAWDDDFAGSTALVCDKGELSETLADEADWASFYEFFYVEGITVPPCFIAVEGDKATLLAGAPAEFARADRLVIAIPTQTQSNAPHVFYKLGMLARAMVADPEDIEDEEAFRAHMTQGVWQQVQAIRRAGKR